MADYLAESGNEQRSALALMAHPDDAEILCAGTLIKLANFGWEIHIATATPGDCGSTSLSREEISHVRRREATVSAAIIGATYHCLEERDVNVIFDRQINQKAIDLFRQINPTIVFTHPRHDYMLDHEQVHLLARSAAFAFPIPNASSLALHAGAKVPWLYYCDPIEATSPYSGSTVKPSTYIDISSEIDTKASMLACHSSQREWLRSHHGMDEYINAMKRHGSFRGKELGSGYAEAFTRHVGHPFPPSDILRQLFTKD